MCTGYPRGRHVLVNKVGISLWWFLVPNDIREGYKVNRNLITRYFIVKTERIYHQNRNVVSHRCKAFSQARKHLGVRVSTRIAKTGVNSSGYSYRTRVCVSARLPRCNTARCYFKQRGRERKVNRKYETGQSGHVSSQ